MLENLKYFLSQRVGIPTEYDKFKRDIKHFNNKDKDYTYIMGLCQNLVSNFNEIENLMKDKINNMEVADFPTELYVKKKEIELLNNGLKNYIGTNLYSIKVNEIMEKEKELSILFQIHYIKTFNALKNSQLSDIYLRNKYIGFLNILKILIDDPIYLKIGDSSATNSMKKLFVNDYMDYDDFELIKNGLNKMVFNLKKLIDSNNNNKRLVDKTFEESGYALFESKRR